MLCIYHVYPWIYMVYPLPWIYMVYPWIYLDIPSFLKPDFLAGQCCWTHAMSTHLLVVKSVLLHAPPWQLCQGKRWSTKGSLLRLLPRPLPLAFTVAALAAAASESSSPGPNSSSSPSPSPWPPPAPWPPPPPPPLAADAGGGGGGQFEHPCDG